MFKSNKPEGPYSMHKFDKRLYDPGFSLMMMVRNMSHMERRKYT